MWSFLLKTLISEVLGAITKMVTDFFKLQKKKKKDAASVKEALDEKDPKLRAKAVRNLLSK